MKLLKKILIIAICLIVLFIVGVTILATTDWGEKAGQDYIEEVQQLDREAQERQ